jgi:hypothetical protein
MVCTMRFREGVCRIYIKGKFVREMYFTWFGPSFLKETKLNGGRLLYIPA